MTDVKMPEPEDSMPYPFGYLRCYTKIQIKQYGDDRARAALETAAKVCEAGWGLGSGDEAAAAIRALKEQIK